MTRNADQAGYVYILTNRVNKVNLTLFAILWTLILAGGAYSQDGTGRKLFSTRFCTVFCEEGVDIKTVNKRLNLSFSDFYSPRGFKQRPDLSIEDMISDKIDAIFNRAEEILDMYPAKIHVAINIYKTQKELNEVYEGFFHEPNTAPSFYIYKTNAIYTVESAINENILAHEMAHCIIDHYFVILPPKKIQEMLAVYVDVHLKD
jgi:hypothetical protein